MRSLCLFVLLAGCAAKVVPLQTKQQEALRITKKCGVASETMVVTSNGQLRIRPKQSERYERIDCVLTELKKSQHLADLPMGFVGNERYGENEQ